MKIRFKTRVWLLIPAALLILILCGCQEMRDYLKQQWGETYHTYKWEFGHLFELEWLKLDGMATVDVFLVGPNGTTTEVTGPEAQEIEPLAGKWFSLSPGLGGASREPSFGVKAQPAQVTAASISGAAYVLDVQSLFRMDITTGKPISSVDLTSGGSGSPLRFDITPDGQHALVTIDNRPNNPTVAVVDLVSFKISTTITIPDKANIYGVAVTPDGKFAYVVTQSLATAQNTVYVIDLSTNQISTSIPLLKYQGLTNIQISPDGTEAYLNSCCGTDFQIPVIDIPTNTVAMDIPTYFYSTATGIISIQSPAYMALHPDGSRVYLAPLDGSPIHVLDTVTKVITKRITVPKGAAPPSSTEPVFSATGRFLFIADCPAAICVIDTTTDTLMSTIPVSAAIASGAPGGTKIGFYFVPGY